MGCPILCRIFCSCPGRSSSEVPWSIRSITLPEEQLEGVGMSEERDGCRSAGCWSESSQPHSQPGAAPWPRPRPGAALARRPHGRKAPAAPCERDKLRRRATPCRAFAGELGRARSLFFSCPLLAPVTQPGALLHTVAGDQINSWNMGNEAIQRRPRASKREVLPRYRALFCLKSLTHTEELYLFLILLSPTLPCPPRRDDPDVCDTCM